MSDPAPEVPDPAGATPKSGNASSTPSDTPADATASPSGSAPTQPAPADAAAPAPAPAEAPGDAPSGEGPSGKGPSGEGTGGEAAEGDVARPRKKRRRRRKPKDGAHQPAAEAQPARTPQNRRGKRPSRPAPSQHNAMTAIRALSSMARDLLQIEGIDVLGMPRFMDVELRIPLDARDASKSASRVIEQILRRVKEVRDHDRALVPGAVYSYRTETAEARACRPQGVRDVFDGYTSTGEPRFTDFVTMAIERKDEGIDELVSGADMVLTHVTMGRVLRTAQLAEFGKDAPTYRILGQVDAGLFPLVNNDKKAAFSFQLLRGATLEGNPHLRLHAVGAADLMDLADPSVMQILSRFQGRLDHESLRLAGLHANSKDAPATPPAEGEGTGTDTAAPVVDEEEFVHPLLTDLAKQLEGRARRAGRRTKHADQRTQEGQRPTTKAWEDAEAAGDDKLLWDDRENTVIVLGPRGRVHVFSPTAKHVTSLVMQGSSIGKRRQQGQWREAEPEERGEFRIAMRSARREAPEQEETPQDPPPAS